MGGGIQKPCKGMFHPAEIEMAEILKKRGVYHEYCESEGEGHGFRKKENMVDALTKEATFFQKVLSGEITL